MNIPLRVTIAVVCFLAGFLFFFMFFIAAVIAWSIYSDIADAPAQRVRDAEMEERQNAAVSVEEVRRTCESPAETAFLDAMVSAYALGTGSGAIEGDGLRLRTQVGIGDYNIQSHGSSYQYRADFLCDEKLVVEIDGATYHSSSEAVARDAKRDADMQRHGYSVLRIPARVVFQTPLEAVAMVEKARETLRKGGSLHQAAITEKPAATQKPVALKKTASGFLNGLHDFSSKVSIIAIENENEFNLRKMFITHLGRMENIIGHASSLTAQQISMWAGEGPAADDTFPIKTFEKYLRVFGEKRSLKRFGIKLIHILLHEGSSSTLRE